MLHQHGLGCPTLLWAPSRYHNAALSGDVQSQCHTYQSKGRHQIELVKTYCSHFDSPKHFQWVFPLSYLVLVAYYPVRQRHLYFHGTYHLYFMPSFENHGGGGQATKIETAIANGSSSKDLHAQMCYCWLNFCFILLQWLHKLLRYFSSYCQHSSISMADKGYSQYTSTVQSLIVPHSVRGRCVIGNRRKTGCR